MPVVVLGVAPIPVAISAVSCGFTMAPRILSRRLRPPLGMFGTFIVPDSSVPPCVPCIPVRSLTSVLRLMLLNAGTLLSNPSIVAAV